jgi:hypothetical protein
MDVAGLRRLLERCGSYPVIEAAAASGELHALFPARLFEHIGVTYHRLERVADPDFTDLAKLRLAVLLHEESPRSLPGILAAAGFIDFAATVIGVIEGFGQLWKVVGDREIAEYVVVQRGHLAALLLFELAHEGRAIPQMERAAELGGLDLSFRRWAARLPTGTPSHNDRAARRRVVARGAAT